VIRYYPRGEGCYLVTARRKPRGYIVARSNYGYKTRITRDMAEESAFCYSGWAPVGFNKVGGPVYHTRRGAAEALLSDHRFDAAPPEQP